MGAMAAAWLTVARVAAPAVMSATVVIVSIIVTTMAAMHDRNAVVAIDWATVAIVGCDDSALVD